MDPDSLVAEMAFAVPGCAPASPAAPASMEALRHIAHEANNLLGIISLNLELTLDDLAPDSDLRAGLLAALEAVFKAAELHDQLRSVALVR